MSEIAVQAATALSEGEARERLVYAEQVVRQMEQVEVPITHHFAEGVYARGGVIKKGTVFVGRVHLQSQINIISKGDMTILMEGGVVRLVGPCTWVSPPGAQRAAYANEDTYWTTILGTHETDPDVIFNTCTSANLDGLTHDDFVIIEKE
jgi:hypothetical protein